MAIPDYEKLMYPVLKLLGENKELSGSQIEDLVAKYVNLSNEDLQLRYPNNSKRIFKDRVDWARTYLKKAGLIDSPQRGTSRITTLGTKILKDKPKEINNKFLKQFKSFRDFKNLSNSKISNSEIVQQEDSIKENQTPIDMIYTGRDVLNTKLENDLLDKLIEKDASLFEVIVAKLLVSMGYGSSYDDIIQLKGKSGDEGIDGIIKQDVLGLDKVYIQAKKWTKSTVSGPEVQKFAGALRQKHATKGVFITTSTFTEAAKKCAKEVSDTIILIDGQNLTKLMIEYNVGIQIEDTVQIKKLDEDFFEDN
ncbi:MAG: restriction endonuclease [Acinetobacter sp.]|nr:restriction endonuclease [Acinetobacter sp.]DAB12848.1 MAG TPA: restriction endonuclease [Candidatus Gastranaerophilales bacterium HUM_16]